MNLRLLMLFVKNGADTSDPRVRERCASVAGAIGIASNLFLSLIKIIVGALSKSISITADAVNNLTDAASSIITLIGFKLSGKPADAEHPYGHRRIEYITGLIVSMVITVLGVEFLINSVQNLLDPSETIYSTVSIVILVLSILIKLWQNRFYVTVGKHINSTTLIATASDSRNDVLATSVVLLGALISKLFSIDLDGWLGCAVALFIIWSGVSLVIETSNPLLGMAPTPGLTKSIGDKITSYDGILGYHDLVVHNYGPDRCFVSVHVEVPAEQDILVSHDIIDNIEFDFLRETGMHVVIHLDPIVTDDPVINDLHCEVGHVIEQLSIELGDEITMHDFRVVRGQSHTNLLFDVAVPFSLKLSDGALRELIDKRIRELLPYCNTVITCDRSYSAETHENK